MRGRSLRTLGTVVTYAAQTVVNEDAQDETNSPVASVVGTLYGLVLGTLFMGVGLAIAGGLTQNLEPRWQKYLFNDGYGTPAQLRAEAELRPLLARWKVREASRVELARTTLPADVLADEDKFSAALEELRDQANDREPNDPGDPLKPLPEKSWDRFSALTTDQRVELFKGLLVGPVFFLPGLFIAVAMLLSLWSGRSARRLAREFPERPWLHHAHWSQLRGSPDGSSSFAGICLMLAIFGWLAFCATLSWALEPNAAWNFTLVTFMVNLAAAFIAALTVRRVLQRFKFGQPQLLLAQVPIELGKTFSARLVMSRSVGAAEKLKATLRLTRSTTAGTGKNQSTDSDVLYERETEVPRSAFFEQDGRLAADLRFEVPEGQPFTRFGNEPTCEWQVVVGAEAAGVDFEETFSVPVYRPRSDAERTLRSVQR